MSEPTPRLEPVRPPFSPELQAVFDKIMPPGVAPLTLFTTSVEQVFELIALVGFYHTVSFLANGLQLAPESYAVPFPPP